MGIFSDIKVRVQAFSLVLWVLKYLFDTSLRFLFCIIYSQNVVVNLLIRRFTNHSAFVLYMSLVAVQISLQFAGVFNQLHYVWLLFEVINLNFTLGEIHVPRDCMEFIFYSQKSHWPSPDLSGEEDSGALFGSP